MNDETAFQDAIDKDLENWDLRLIFADWLGDHDQDREMGYRAIVANRIVGSNTCTMDWATGRFDWMPNAPSTFFESGSFPHKKLPGDWYAALDGFEELSGSHNPDLALVKNGKHKWKTYENRRAAENALARDFLKLHPWRQKQLLGGSWGRRTGRLRLVSEQGAKRL